MQVHATKRGRSSDCFKEKHHMVFLIRIRNVSKYNEANNFSIPPPTVYDMNHIDIMPKTGSYFWSIVIKQVGWG